MSTKTQSKTCVNCKKDFTIEAEDFGFYEKIKVPPPTLCPECRQQRRYAWRNERNLYRRNCDLCQKSMVTIYSPNKPFKVYCTECWWGDGWDPASYGRDFDFNRPFFEQFGELQHEVPRRVYEYGEFFPIEISPIAYNESAVQEFFPLSKEEALKKGYPWKELDTKNFEITINAENIPDNIDEVDDTILKEVLGCAHKGTCNQQCNTAFRLTDYELKFYKKHNIPLPILCPNCRHYERYKVMPPLKLWHKKCMKEGCNNEFETSYAPDRTEIIYCERCYQQEVY